MYEARKISNFLLANYDAREFDITNLRLNKILYFIHGEAFVDKPQGLIRNHFEAWRLGPVIRPVYENFKVFGEGQITRLAQYLDYGSGEKRDVPHSDIAPSDAGLIRRIFEIYSRYSTGKLVALSHEPGGPWDITIKAWEADQRMSPRIPNDLIRKYFVGDSRLTAFH
jgi:uncharacterized phage-associated protein